MRANRLLAGAIVGFFVLTPALLPAQKAVRERSEIDEKYKWNLADIYTSDENWEADFQRAQTMKAELEGLRDELGELDSGEKILALHRRTEAAQELLERLFIYAFLKADEDTRISEYQGYKQKIRTLAVDVSTVLAWVEPSLLAIPRERLQGFLDRTEGLKLYQHHYDDLWRQQEHVLSEKEERILSLAGEMSATPRSVYSQMMNADLKFGTFLDENGEEVEMTQARYGSYMRNPDRRVRADAWSVYYDGYEKYLNAAVETYAGAVKRDIFYTRARGYESCAQRALDADNVDLDVLENLISTVSDNLAPIRRYNEIRAQVMEYDTLYHWDSYVSLVPSLDEEIPYEKAVETIIAGLAPLGTEYVAEMTTGFRSRWVDVYENAGKRDGAYSWGTFAVPHPYMLMNYEDNIDTMFTLAHEMGHSMHTFYTVATQPQVYADYPIFVAEVASTTNEAILMDYLLKQTQDREKRIFLLNQWISKIQGTVYTQVMFSEFEKITHEMAERGEALTVESLGEVYGGLLDKYSGGVIHYTDRSANGWCRIPHFYGNFYVYKYATSYAAATSIARRILAGEPGALEAYLEFLRSGSSAYPIELLQRAGVDLSHPEPIRDTCELLAELVDELDGLLAGT